MEFPWNACLHARSSFISHGKVTQPRWSAVYGSMERDRLSDPARRHRSILAFVAEDKRTGCRLLRMLPAAGLTVMHAQQTNLEGIADRSVSVADPSRWRAYVDVGPCHDVGYDGVTVADGSTWHGGCLWRLLLMLLLQPGDVHPWRGSVHLRRGVPDIADGLQIRWSVPSGRLRSILSTDPSKVVESQIDPLPLGCGNIPGAAEKTGRGRRSESRSKQVSGLRLVLCGHDGRRNGRTVGRVRRNDWTINKKKMIKMQFIK